MRIGLLPFGRPSFGVHIDDGGLSVVDARPDWRRGWRRLRLGACAQRTLPPGFIRLSSVEANVMNVDAVAQEISGAVGGRRGIPIGLSLSDRCARTALFEFEGLPKRPSEVEALLRWRFQTDLGVDMPDGRLAYRVFRPVPSSDRAAGASLRILAVIQQTAVLDSYLRACEAAGLVPVTVGLTSFLLFDACRAAIRSAIAGLDRAAGRCPEEWFVLVVTKRGFALLAFQRNLPVFLRMKSLEYVASHRSGDRPDSRESPSHPAVDSLEREVLATLQFYADTRPRCSRGGGARPSPLFVVGTSDGPMAEREVGNCEIVPIQWPAIAKAMKLAERPTEERPNLQALAPLLGG